MLPPEVKFLVPVFTAFLKQDFEIYLVGGCVRDLILNQEVKDFDFTTNARPDDIRRILGSIGAHIINKNGGNFGTVHCIFNGEDIEITTYRVDNDYPAGSRRPEVAFSDSLQEDLLRRDFTINAIVMDVKGDIPEFCQAFQIDLKNRLLRSPQDPMKLFRDDPLRVLRMYRFWLKYDLDPESMLRQAARFCAPLIKILSKERVHDELIKIASGPYPHLAFRFMMQDGVLQQIIPELTVQVGFDQKNPHHNRPLWEHTLSAVELASEVTTDYRIILATLLHDVGKPTTVTERYVCEKCGSVEQYRLSPLYPKGNTPDILCKVCLDIMHFEKCQYIHHEVEGEIVARNILNDLKFSKDDVSYIGGLVREHNIQYESNWPLKSIRRLLNRVGDRFDGLMVLTRADRLAHADHRMSIEHLNELIEKAKTVDLQEVVKPKPLISGQKVMDTFGLRSGPAVGRVLDQLVRAQVDGDVTTLEEAMGFLLNLREKETVVK